MQRCSALLYVVFFFQAEDGIRDVAVTGVQTCALPISSRHLYLILSIVDLDRAAYGVHRRLGQGPRDILWKVSVGSDSHTNNAVRNLGNSNLGLAGRQLGAILEALLKYLDALYFAEVVPALSKQTHACYTAEQQPRCQASNQRSHVHPRCVRRQAIARKTQTLSPLPSAALWHP